jgi:hypothetical protein
LFHDSLAVNLGSHLEWLLRTKSTSVMARWIFLHGDAEIARLIKVRKCKQKS